MRASSLNFIGMFVFGRLFRVFALREYILSACRSRMMRAFVFSKKGFKCTRPTYDLLPQDSLIWHNATNQSEDLWSDTIPAYNFEHAETCTGHLYINGNCTNVFTFSLSANEMIRSSTGQVRSTSWTEPWDALPPWDAFAYGSRTPSGSTTTFLATPRFGCINY